MPETSSGPSSIGNEDSTRDQARQELTELRDELARMAKDLRMKTLGAGAEAQGTLSALETEYRRFATQVDLPAQERLENIRQLGERLKRRFEKLHHQLASDAK
jgi:hypothetical protein